MASDLSVDIRGESVSGMDGTGLRRVHGAILIHYQPHEPYQGKRPTHSFTVLTEFCKMRVAKIGQCGLS